MLAPTSFNALAGDLTATLRRVLQEANPPATARGEIRLVMGRLLLGADENEAAYVEIEAALLDLQACPALAARAMLHLAWPLTRVA